MANSNLIRFRSKQTTMSSSHSSSNNIEDPPPAQAPSDTHATPLLSESSSSSSIHSTSRHSSSNPVNNHLQMSSRSRSSSQSSFSVSSRRSWIRAVAFFRSQSMLMDEHASDPRGIVLGLAGLIFVGVLLGVSLPKNESLPTPWYRVFSSIVGYTYFLAWSISFYPQVFSNYKRRSTRGLSPDFCGLNVIGFTCYSIYNCTFFWSKTVQQLYRERYGETAELTVQSNDVAFAVHALILSSVTFSQIGYFDGVRAWRPSKLIAWIMAFILGSCLLLAITIGLGLGGPLNWLDYLYWLSFVKVGVTLIKYIPQAYLNFRRKSTTGWSIWNILLDFSGGVLSTLQLVMDCADLKDFTGITGNLAKFGLGFVSIVFDVLFILQHYVFYRHSNIGTNGGAADGIAYATAPSINEEKTDDAVV